jgi:hypothetical protein
MSKEEARPSRRAAAPAESEISDLSSQDVARLTNYKWRYSLESHGFSSDQAGRLLFIKWLFRRGAVEG